jgi:hypothetical protein
MLQIRDGYPSWILDPVTFIHPGSHISDTGFRIQDPTTATKEKRRKNFDVLTSNF